MRPFLKLSLTESMEGKLSIFNTNHQCAFLKLSLTKLCSGKRAIKSWLKPTCIFEQSSIDSGVTNPSVVFVDEETRFVCVNNKDSDVHIQCWYNPVAHLSHSWQAKITTINGEFEAIFLLYFKQKLLYYF